jgi:hypothetical protein
MFIKQDSLQSTSATIVEKCLQYNQDELLHTFMIFFLTLNTSFESLYHFSGRLLQAGNNKNKYYKKTLKEIVQLLCQNTSVENRYFEQESRIGQLIDVVNQCIKFGNEQNNFHCDLVGLAFEHFLDQEDIDSLISIGKIFPQNVNYFSYFFDIITYLILSEVNEPFWDPNYKKVKKYLMQKEKENKIISFFSQNLIDQYYDMLALCFDESNTSEHQDKIKSARELLQYIVNHQQKNSENTLYQKYAEEILTILQEN